MCPRQAACWFQSVSGSHLLVWIWGCDAFSQGKKHTHSGPQSSDILLDNRIRFFLCPFSCNFKDVLFCNHTVSRCFQCWNTMMCNSPAKIYIYIYLSETLKHFLFPPLHEWAIEQTVLLKLNSHSFIYMVSDCPFLAKKTQFLSFYSYFNSVVSALSCVKKKMILLWMALTETPATKPHLRAKFPFYSQRWSGSKHQESRAEERNLNSWCILPVNK